MPFYIRKSVSVGPFRFNLSKSGVGVSAGVRGLRVGAGPRGNYIHMGRGGLYYRSSLNGPPRPALNVKPSHFTSQSSHVGNEEKIEIGNVADMTDVSGADLLLQINQKSRMWRFWPLALMATVFMVWFEYSSGKSETGVSVFLIGVVLTLLLAWNDRIRRTVVFMYDLDDNTESVVSDFVQQFERVSVSKKAWNIDTRAAVLDSKYHAGAGQIISRTPVVFGLSAPNVLKTNIPVPSIRGGRVSVYFLPDVILLNTGKEFGALGYNDFVIDWDEMRFIETDGVPKDSRIVDQTWRYVNKKGGPDRRFSNNPQIPVVLYQRMHLRGDQGFDKILHLSALMDHGAFDRALNDMRQLARDAVSKVA